MNNDKLIQNKKYSSCFKFYVMQPIKPPRKYKVLWSRRILADIELIKKIFACLDSIKENSTDMRLNRILMHQCRQFR